jgi:SAM-dependent methyltransferase
MDRTPTSRFSDRVANYVRYRPGYPAEVMDLLRGELGLRKEHIVADVASGTGIFTRLLLENGNQVFAVEPNREMREAGENFLREYRNLVSVAGKAEETTLPSAAVDFVTAAQAAHWFNRERARREFVRILKPGGVCVLIWNERRLDNTAFARDYEEMLLQFGTDYKEVRHERTTAEIGAFFKPAPYQERVYELRQQFDYEGALGRLLSSSYAPPPDHPHYQPMLEALRRIYQQHNHNDRIEFEYNTRVFFGKLT